jgi:hypothetical protein
MLDDLAAPIENLGPRLQAAAVSRWPVARLNSGANSLNAAVKPPEIKTPISAAGAGSVENAAATGVMVASAMDLHILMAFSPNSLT